MEEIRAGEYVRWKGGSIRKVTRLLTSDETYIEIDGLGDIATYKWEMLKNMITKHSPNIIDLVEVGDYVNGKEVKHIADFEGVKEPIRKLIFVDEHRLVPGETAKNDEIKSIVTKEQFEEVEYKLDN